jgi:hypothetical protein
LSRWAGVQIEDLAALSPDRDPFLQGTPAHTRDAAEFVRLTAGVNLDVHLRGLYYRLLSLDSTGFDGNWKWLQKAAARARDLGLVDPWAFPDKRTRALLIEKIAADSTCVVFNEATGQRTMCRLGILSVSNQLTIVAVGPGSG